MESRNMLEWRNVSVWGPKPSRSVKQYFTSTAVRAPQILDNVSGSVKSGSFVAVLGPSGSGKTTILAELSGRSRLRSKGVVSLNGRQRSEASCALVPQQDILVRTLTVAEHLFFVAEMKLHELVSKNNQTKKLNAVMDELKLTNQRDVQIRHLSGGEQKAVALASVILSEPPVIFCDEPTTGMDSYSAVLIVNLLKALSENGRIVICSIHQPTSQIFKSFSEIILMSDGKMVFQGCQKSCLLFFESVGLRCPITYNPSEYYLRQISNRETVSILTNKYENKSSEFDTSLVEFMPNIEVSKAIQAPWLSQLILLTWRNWVDSKRNITEYYTQSLLLLVKALLFSSIYFGISGTTQQGIQDMRGLHYTLCFEAYYNAEFSVLLTFHDDLALYKREHNMYSASAFYLSKILTMLPRLLMNQVILVGVISTVVSFPSPGETFFANTGTLVLMSVSAACYGLMLSAVFPDSGYATLVVTPLDLIISTCGGLYINLHSLPQWMEPVKFISSFYYGVGALSKITWTQIDSLECSSDPKLPCVDSGLEVLESFGYMHTSIYMDFVGFLVISTVMTIIGIISLRIQGKYGAVAY